jgi:3D (Asp-Asp-Asp) domain-containing protein
MSKYIDLPCESSEIKGNSKCTLCAREIVDNDSSVSLQKEYGTYIVFDTMGCIKIFQKLTDIYGDAFDESCL